MLAGEHSGGNELPSLGQLRYIPIVGFGHTVPPGRAVITDQIESPVFVPVCEGCELGLDGVAAAATLRAMKPGRDSPLASSRRTANE